MKYVAFLRAINVGGHALIKMTDLKKLFESAGLEHVETYIQSGNVIFESDQKADVLARQIERQLEEAAEYKIELFVRTMREVRSIVKQSPFQPKTGEAVYVTFLNGKPGRKSQQELLNFWSKADDFAFRGREVYSLPRDRENSVFSNNFIEKQLKMRATSRNLTTLTKIVEKFGESSKL
jgi:uncharacterized protein (DUF1697 family)